MRVARYMSAPRSGHAHANKGEARRLLEAVLRQPDPTQHHDTPNSLAHVL